MAQDSNQGAFTHSDEWQKVLARGHLGQNWLRRTLRNLPSSPRCKVCNNPFGGIGGKICGLVGMSRSRKNPNICALCCEKMPKGGAEVETAILFADVRNSTEIAENLGPTRYFQALDRFYEIATGILIRHDATIDKLIGDEVMAFFIPGHAGQEFKHAAVEAARKVMKAMEQPASGCPELPIGIGLQSGIAFAGNMGPEDVVDFTVVGDPVNVAARIQAAASPGEILIGNELFDAVKSHYPDAESRLIDVKGKSVPLKVYSLRMSSQQR